MTPKLYVLNTKTGATSPVIAIYIDGDLGGHTKPSIYGDDSGTITGVYCADGTSYDGYSFRPDGDKLQTVKLICEVNI